MKDELVRLSVIESTFQVGRRFGCTMRVDRRQFAVDDTKRAVPANLILMRRPAPDQHPRRVGLMKSTNVGFDKP
jgi:hypothetical protein